MKKVISALFIYFTLFMLSTGSILWMDQLIVEFKPKSSSLSNVKWDPIDAFNITTNGFGWAEKPGTSSDLTLRFKPMPIGMSWRPAKGLTINIKVIFDQSKDLLNNGQKSKPKSGQFYVRYSANRRDWSSWINIPKNTKNTSKDWLYDIELSVPNIDMKEYQKYYNEFQKLDVPWVDNQDALARWIIKKDPNFFAKHIPFTGWIEILYEDSSITESPRLKKVNITLAAGISGIETPPKDPKNKNYISQSSWKFYQK